MATKGLMFGKPPFRFFADHLAQDTDFLEDARHILELDEGAYQQLAAHLAEADAFLTHSDLTAIVHESLGEGSERIASFVSRLGEIIHDADMDAIDAMNALGESIEKKAEDLEPQERRTLTERLRTLVAEPIGIAKQYKAQQLVDATGAELDAFRIICDIRPIFDQNRERIDGAIPLTILRLEYSKPDGESEVVELRATEKQIERLGERIADANLKLKMIKELLANQDLPIPRTKATVAEDEH